MSAVDRFRLDGKVALVTGAGRGLGQGIAVALAEAGADVIVMSRTQSELDETAAIIESAGVKAHTLIADFSDVEQVAGHAGTAWQWQDRIDIVVPAAGMQIRRLAHEFSAAEFRLMMDVHLAAPFLLSAAVGEKQIAAGSQGRHIFMGSLSSRIGLPNVVPYGAAKSGVTGLVHGLAREWAPHGITVNAVLPGYFDTALTKTLFADKARYDWVMSRIPMGKLGDAEDVAAACVYLASDAAKYVSGECLAVDGGWLAS